MAGPDDDGGLAAVSHREEQNTVALPGIETPVGAAQRLRIFVPTPESLFTVGAIGNNDARHHPAGPGGFSFRTVEHLAAEIHKNTILDTDLNTTIHTGETLTGVAGKKLELSTNGDAQLGAVGGISITADGSAGFTDPDFTVEPAEDVPANPAIDTAIGRGDSEGQLRVWNVVWGAYKHYKGAKSLSSLAKDFKLSEGVAEGANMARLSAAYGHFKTGKMFYESAKSAIVAMLESHDSDEKDEKDAGAGSPKVSIHAADGIALTTPAKISGYANDGISLLSTHDVTLKAGISASLNSLVSSTVFSMVSSKLESLQMATVKGKITSIKGEKTEVIGKDILALSSKHVVSATSDESVLISAKNEVEVAGTAAWVAGEKYATIRSKKKLEMLSLETALLKGDKKVTVESDEQIFMAVKNSDIQITDGKINLGIGSFIATIDSSSFVCGNTNIKKSEATMKGTIRLG